MFHGTILKRYLQLPPAARGLTVHALWLLWAFRLGAWACSGTRLLRLVEAVPAARRRPNAAGTVEEIGRAVLRASRWVPRASCLPQALVAAVLLKRSGLPAAVEIGVAVGNASTLIAHAWTVSGSKVVIGGPLEASRFTRLQRVGPIARAADNRIAGEPVNRSLL